MRFCSALKFKNETSGICCAGGKVKLPELHSPPEPLSWPSMDRHDISARVFKQKLKFLMDYIVKHQVFGDTLLDVFRWMAKMRIATCTHFYLVGRKSHTRSNWSSNISRNTKCRHWSRLIWRRHLKHNSWSMWLTQNNSPCMSDGKCTKRYPRDLLPETITGNLFFCKQTCRSVFFR